MKKFNIYMTVKSIISSSFLFQVLFFSLLYIALFFPQELVTYKKYSYTVILFLFIFILVIFIFNKNCFLKEVLKKNKIKIFDYLYMMLELLNVLILQKYFFSLNSKYVKIYNYLGMGKYDLKISNVSLIVLVSYSVLHLILSILFFKKSREKSILLLTFYLFILRLLAIYFIFIKN